MPRLNMSVFPTEILQMIWGELISTPACHTFKVKMGNHPKEGTKWAVHLWPKEFSDTSAYLRWKQLLSLKLISFQMAFRRFVKHLQPIELRLLGKNKLCTATAAIDAAQDLVILEMDRGKSLPWFEHNTSNIYSMDGQLIQERMRHFRRVAIHYKFGQRDCASEGAFLCLCHGVNQPHDDYNACPLTLACFLDLFQNLEQFYFVVDAKLVWHKKFATQYHGRYIQYHTSLSNQTELIFCCADEVAKNGFRARIDAPGGAQVVGKQYTLARFFDTKYEYLQQAPYAYLEAIGRTGSADTSRARTEKPPSPWIGAGSAQQCLVETQQFYKSQKGNERFRQDLEKRKNVRFGVLITYPLQDTGKKGST